MSLVQDRRETLGARVDPRIELDWMNSIGQIAEFCELVANLTQASPTIVVRFVDVRAEGSDEVHSSGLLFVCDLLVKNLTLFHVGRHAFREGLVAIFRQHFAHHGALFYSHKPASDRTLYDATIIEEHMASSASFDNPALVAVEGCGGTALLRPRLPRDIRNGTTIILAMCRLRRRALLLTPLSKTRLETRRLSP